jgi:hypothetical protein
MSELGAVFGVFAIIFIMIMACLRCYCTLKVEERKREDLREEIRRQVLNEMIVQQRVGRQQQQQNHQIIVEIEDPPPAYSTVGPKY